MAKNRKIPLAVRSQVSMARMQEAPEADTVSPLTAMAQVRLAVRKMRNDALAAEPASIKAPKRKRKGRRAVARKTPKEFSLKEGSLFTAARQLFVKQSGGVGWVLVEKGSSGIILGSISPVDGIAPPGVQVMISGMGVFDLTPSYFGSLRDASELEA
jgi:hypothetical protein